MVDHSAYTSAIHQADPVLRSVALVYSASYLFHTGDRLRCWPSPTASPRRSAWRPYICCRPGEGSATRCLPPTAPRCRFAEIAGALAFGAVGAYALRMLTPYRVSSHLSAKSAGTA
jgi:hypothetical protein